MFMKSSAVAEFTVSLFGIPPASGIPDNYPNEFSSVLDSLMVRITNRYFVAFLTI
jgi:hypothetical protein